MKQPKILLLFGGESPEHEVSMISARNVYKAIDKKKYYVNLCYIDKNGLWWLVDSIRPAAKNDKKLQPVLGEGKFQASSGTLQPDVLLPVLHGQNGEDGTIQGLARLLHIPIAGPSLTSSVVSMDKDITKKLLTAADLPVTDWIALPKGRTYPPYKLVIGHLGETLFVKPATAGSSIGVSKVSSPGGYDKAVRQAFEHSRKIIIESAVLGAREIEVAVLGNARPKVTAPGEIIPGEEFYSYDDKYAEASGALVKIPADLDEEAAEAVKKMALQAYRATDGYGMARIDFFLTHDKKIFINEINAIPGFTDISMYPKLWQHEGLSYAGLIDKLLQLALEGET